MAIYRREFSGQTVDYACYDPRSGTYFAASTHGQFGPHLYVTTDLESGWTEVEGLALPKSSDIALERIWLVQPGAAEG